MPTTDHTPGPWRLDIGKHGAAISNGGTIADINDTMTAWRADARLIAAAPDLLETLETVDAYLAPDGDDDDVWHEIRAIIQTSIAKAKGV